MDSDAYTCGTCKHGNLYEAGCEKCEAEYEAQQALIKRFAEENTRLRRGEFICQKCGLRKDGECATDHDF